MAKRKVNFTTFPYDIKMGAIGTNCNLITITNYGLDAVIVNGKLLNPGEALDPTTYAVVPPSTAGAIPTTGDSFTWFCFPDELISGEWSVQQVTSYGDIIIDITRKTDN